jgi:DNA-binding response OmpR family regulator
MTTILIVDDEKAISNLIRLHLETAGYRALEAPTPSAALAIMQATTIDLILLDIMLPEMSGFELMQKLRTEEVPVIFLTAVADTAEKIRGLRLGADDYITKPFDDLELLARVEAVLRRYGKREDVLHFEDVTIDPVRHVVEHRGCAVEMSAKEYDLLTLLVRHPGRVLTREQILSQVWEYEYYGGSRTVDTHIQKLRQKLDWHDKIVTVYKVGYRLEH